MRFAWVAIALLFALGNAKAAEDPGRAAYEKHCAACHDAGPGHPGTMRLTELRGADSAVLLERRDLSAAYIKAVVRNGMLEMPPLRPTDIADAQLDSLAEYLSHETGR